MKLSKYVAGLDMPIGRSRGQDHDSFILLVHTGISDGVLPPYLAINNSFFSRLMSSVHLNI